jgi:hypothetical protein
VNYQPIQLNEGIELLNGKMFDFMNPDPHAMSIEEFAHVAGNICRFAGHVRYFYSLAQHLLNTSLIVDQRFRKAALLHDKSEGYTNDIVTPLKIQVPLFKDIETAIEAGESAVYGIPYPFPPEVKLADLQMLAIEKSILKPSASHWAILDGIEWEHLVDHCVMAPMTPEMAKAAFLQRWEEVCAD